MSEANNLPEKYNPEQMVEIFKGAPAVLQLNSGSSARAVAASVALLNEIVTAGGMTDEFDERINGHLVKLKKSLETMNERRKPFTQMMDEVKTMFTACEKQIDPKSDSYMKLQFMRDDWAKKKAQLRQEEERKQKLELEKEKERVSIATEFVTEAEKKFIAFVGKCKAAMSGNFDKITLENIDRGKKWIEECYPELTYSDYTQLLTFQPFVSYLTETDIHAIREKSLAGLFENLKESFATHIGTLRRDLLDKLPSKRQELEAIEKAKREGDEKEAARIKHDQEQREIKDREAAAQKLEEELRNKTEEGESNVQAAVTNAVFDATADTLAVEQPAAKVRESITITVLNPQGYMLLLAQYFQKKGGGEPVADLDKRTFKQVKTFCEKLANDSDDNRLQSPFLKYKESFKVMATKS